MRNVNKKNIIEDISSLRCFNILSDKTNSYLVDVRTSPEWEFVGIPDLSIIKKQTILVSFLFYPKMNENKNKNVMFFSCFNFLIINKIITI